MWFRYLFKEVNVHLAFGIGPLGERFAQDMQLNIDKTILGSSVRNSTYKALKTFDFKPSFQFLQRDRIMYGRLGSGGGLGWLSGQY